MTYESSAQTATASPLQDPYPAPPILTCAEMSPLIHRHLYSLAKNICLHHLCCRSGQFFNDKKVKFIGVEAAGLGLATGKHSASLVAGHPGVLHGSKSDLLEDEFGHHPGHGQQ
jgi:hypothetical protein